MDLKKFFWIFPLKRIRKDMLIKFKDESLGLFFLILFFAKYYCHTIANQPKSCPCNRIFISFNFKVTCIIVKHSVAIWRYCLLYYQVAFIGPVFMLKN